MNPIYVGLSGYSYKPWQGVGRFYPEKLKSTEFLKYYAGRFKTVELDGVVSVADRANGAGMAGTDAFFFHLFTKGTSADYTYA